VLLDLVSQTYDEWGSRYMQGRRRGKNLAAKKGKGDGVKGCLFCATIQFGLSRLPGLDHLP